MSKGRGRAGAAEGTIAPGDRPRFAGFMVGRATRFSQAFVRDHESRRLAVTVSAEVHHLRVRLVQCLESGRPRVWPGGNRSRARRGAPPRSPSGRICRTSSSRSSLGDRPWGEAESGSAAKKRAFSSLMGLATKDDARRLDGRTILRSRAPGWPEDGAPRPEEERSTRPRRAMNAVGVRVADLGRRDRTARPSVRRAEIVPAHRSAGKRSHAICRVAPLLE